MMDKDEIIKNLTSQVNVLQERVKSYAKLGKQENVIFCICEYCL